MSTNVKVSAATAALVLFVACAKQMPPPGGPPDEIPPRVATTQPRADTTDVPLDTQILVRFNERMDRRSVSRAVFVSPRHGEPPELRWHGDKLEIRVPEGLRPDRTYVVTVGAECADISRNRMTASHSFAFATGSQLNQGVIGGRVIRDPVGRGQAYILAYDLADAPDPIPGGSEPAYITQPGSDGNYELPRLGPGKYRLFALMDRDGDRTYTAGKDLLGVPPSDVDLTREQEQIGLGPIRPVLRDTVGPLLTSVRTPDNRHMMLRFDEVVRLPDSLEVGSDAGTLLVLSMHHAPDDSSRVWAVTGPQVESTTYRVSAGGFADSAGNPGDGEEALEVRGETREDTHSPSVALARPDTEAVGVPPDAPLTVVFSEAMRPAVSDSFWMATDSTSAPEGTFSWPAPNRLRFVPDRPWPLGTVLSLVGRSHSLTDVAGNRCTDPVGFRFTVRSEGVLGDLAGTVAPSTYPIVLMASELGEADERRHVVVAPGDSVYRIRGLPSGRYRVWGFGDSDGDGTWHPGRPRPFVAAEPTVLSADTIEVRARWEAESDRRLRIDRVYPIEITEGE